MTAHRTRTLRLLPALLLTLATTPAASQVEAFRFDAALIPVGTVFHYTKTDLAGGHRSQIALYVAAPDRIESFKYGDGSGDGTLVIGWMDWPRFSLRRLESWRLVDTSERRLQGWLQVDSADPGAVRLVFAPDTPIRIGHWPWHSYDFDWASLNLTLPMLRRPDRPFSVHRTDIIYGEESVGFGEVGTLTFTPAGRSRRNGRAVRGYTLTGPAIADSTGMLWVAAEDGSIVEYRIPVPDEPGIRDVHLVYDRRTRMTPAEWQAFQRTTLTPSAGR